MSNFWDIYEELQELVYVTDIDTDELVYVNRHGRKLLKFDTMEEVKGQHCYKVLQNCSTRCAICTNHKLKAGAFYEWKYRNNVLGKTFLLKDTLVEQDGRRYRLEISIDASEMDEQKQTIKEFASNEAMINEAMRLAFTEPTPEKSLETLLKHLGQFLQSDRIYIFEGKEGEPVSNTYEWCAEGVEPQMDMLQNVPFEVVALWYNTFHKNENIIIKELDSIKESHPQVYETLLPQQIDSLVVSPLVLNDEIIGFYGVDNPPKEFLNHISVMFMMLGYFMASLLRSKNLIDKLEQLSYYDQLTGALNRHGMNEFVAEVDQDASIGIIYCDVMGLKRINDTKGHLAGDKLLKRAYECIRNVFQKKEVFRIGGDEFLIMNSNVSREELQEKMQCLRDTMAKYDVLFAIGGVWEEKCNGRMKELLKIADARMYEDKTAYYSKHPHDRRER